MSNAKEWPKEKRKLLRKQKKNDKDDNREQRQIKKTKEDCTAKKITIKDLFVRYENDIFVKRKARRKQSNWQTNCWWMEHNLF